MVLLNTGCFCSIIKSRTGKTRKIRAEEQKKKRAARSWTCMSADLHLDNIYTINHPHRI